MKLKSLLFIVVAVLGVLSCSARDEYSTDVSVLPQPASKVLSTYFPKVAVSHIKIDKNVFGVESYDVILNDGTEVEFDGKGSLKEVDCSRNGSVPSALVPKSILDYVAKSYPGQNIIKYDVKHNGYEVEIQSGLDLIFNKQGVFRGVDD